MGALKAFAPRDNNYVEAKNKLVNNVENFYKGREKIIRGFKNGVFPVYYDKHEEFRKEDEEEQEEQKSIEVDYKTLIKQITDEETDINNELFKEYFKFQRPSDMLVFLNKKNDTGIKNQLVKLINSGLKDLKEEIKKISKAEIEIEKPDEIVNIVEKILKFNEQNQQKGRRIKILTPNQMLNRLPIALAQLNAANSSNKLKNKIRQLLYSLYCSKNMTEQIYKCLIGII